MRNGAPAEAGSAATGSSTATAGTPDEALMLAYVAGDAAAFDALYARHKGPLYRYFKRQLPEAEANDCFQTLWLKLIDHRDRYQSDAPFRNFLFTLAHNVLMDQHRKNMRNSERSSEQDLDEVASNNPDPADSSERSQLMARLHALIAALPLAQREAWLLRQETDLSTQEIAEVTGSSEEGIKSRLRYARNKLKEGMARYAG